ncbi:MAG: NUDIX domain-containing protein [Propionibacteriaceae bacterium]|nr:NUDIX domain-containing protein [Propionibacteriaceae bacterium]
MATPGFITELRRHIGHAPLWLIGANVLVLRDGASGPEVLLFRRSDNGDWAGIAGIVEPGEHPEATVVREAKEEGCIDVEVERLLWVVVMDEITYVNGDRCQFLDHGFRARLVGGEPAIGDGEACDWGWFPVDQLPEPRQERLDALIRICLADPPEVVTSLEGW